MHRKSYIGLDIGKTKVACAMVDSEGKMSGLVTEKTEQRGGKRLVLQCFDVVEKTIRKSGKKPAGIGIGTSGVVRNDGYVDSESDGWLKLPMKKLFEGRFRLPVRVDNDVRAAAIGEHLFGASRGFRSSVFVIVGTGMGMCAINDGKIARGSHGLAGHIGRLVLIENEERQIEHFYSGRGLEGRALREMRKNVSAEEIFEMAARGDKDMGRLVDEATSAAGATVAWIQNTIDPDIIVFGGSVAMKQKNFVAEAKRKAEKNLAAYMRAAGLSGLNVVKSRLSGNAGVLGAAGLFMAR